MAKLLTDFATLAYSKKYIILVYNRIFITEFT